MKIVIVGGCPKVSSLVICTLAELHTRRPSTRIMYGYSEEWVLVVEGWAWQSRFPTRCYPANWNAYRRHALEFRDKAILNEGRPDLLLAMGSGTRVTRMKLQSKFTRIPVVVPYFDLVTGGFKKDTETISKRRAKRQPDIARLSPVSASRQLAGTTSFDTRLAEPMDANLARTGRSPHVVPEPRTVRKAA